MAGLFNKVRNKPTGRRFLISTIKRDDQTFETAVFRANIFFLPQGFRLSNPCLVKLSQDPEAADKLHHALSERLKTEFPERLFQEFAET